MWKLADRSVIQVGFRGARNFLIALLVLPACAGLLWLWGLAPPAVNPGFDRGTVLGISVPELPPLDGLDVFSPTVVEEAYLFAAERAEVMDAIPCSCGCARAGHAASTDCFVKIRGIDSQVRAWEPHGARCAICVDIARVSRRLYGAGKSIEEIRAQVVGLWGDSTVPVP